MSRFLQHGRIVGGIVTTPDLDAALADYGTRLGLNVVERGTLADPLAASWGCPASAGSRYATLQPQSGVHSFIRLVEQPVPAGFRPTTTFGWNAYELTVQDVFGWPARLDGSGFTVVGPPKEIPGLPYFVAMQMTGPGKEMIYLNEVRSDTPTSDLPRAASPVDHAFIVILATPNRAATMAWYRDTLGFIDGGTYTIPYSMINRAFDLPADHMTTISMAQAGRMPIVEVDDYPEQATERRRDDGLLPAGNALVTLAVDTLDRAGLSFITPPARHGGPFYGERRSATVRGPAGELLELLETGS